MPILLKMFCTVDGDSCIRITKIDAVGDAKFTFYILYRNDDETKGIEEL
jgi:hypothetical protein